MPGRSPAKPKATPPRPSRRFTLAQAVAALPLVRRVVQDIVNTHQEVLQLQQLVPADAAARPSDASRELELRWERLQDYVDELTEIGCELKDFRLGLIDFVGRHQGRDVYLCWKLGEETIEHFHELHAGFAGRMPVSELQEDQGV